jgi:AAA15 family ATPase/GTPase
MNLLKFRIKNYKSIVDTGWCELSGDNITVLAGQNESGKTNILKALRDFDLPNKIKDSSFPDGKDDTPEIECIFEVTRKDLENIFNELNLTPDKEIILKFSELTLNLIKNSKNSFSISKESRISLLNLLESVKQTQKSTLEKLHIKINLLEASIKKHEQSNTNPEIRAQ